jgi:methylated-DNA-[protein]-cysteine S-methyltransferase
MVTAFQHKVYALARKIPKGKVSGYGKIAKRLKSSPRAVGQALKKNPFWPKVPCHRVVCSNGLVGGFCGKINSKKKIKLLEKEGVRVYKGKIDKKYFI